MYKTVRRRKQKTRRKRVRCKRNTGGYDYSLSRDGLSDTDLKEHYSKLMIYYAKRINQMGKDHDFNLNQGWGECLEGCLDLCREAVSEELDHVQYYINLVRNGFGKYGDRVQFTPVSDSSWSKEKHTFLIRGLRGHHSHLSHQRHRTHRTHRTHLGGNWRGGKNVDIVLVSGPSAAGKTYWTKEGLLDALFPKDIFFVIDGGSYRELSVMYQIINLLAQTPYGESVTLDTIYETSIPDDSLKRKLVNLDLRGWGGEGILNLNPTSKRDFISRKIKVVDSTAIFDSDIVKNSMKDILKKSSKKVIFTLVIPDTLTSSINKAFFTNWWSLSSSNHKLRKCVVHVYQHYSESASEEDARPHTIETKYGVVRCCKTTLESGIEREKSEGKKYTASSSTWMKSQKRGLRKCLSALKESGYCIIIHNNNNKDRDEEILDYSAISIWYNKETSKSMFTKMKRWVNKLHKVKFKGYGLSTEEIDSMEYKNRYELANKMEYDLLVDGDNS